MRIMSFSRLAIDRPFGRPLWLVPVAALGLLIGFLATAAPELAAVLVGLVAGLLILALGHRAITVFHVALGVILVGYAFMGKGFAYLGVPPLYVGEVTLGLSVVAVAMSLSTARFGALHGLLLAFMAWCAFRTVPYLGTYGIDALRDSATWSYAFFAIA